MNSLKTYWFGILGAIMLLAASSCSPAFASDISSFNQMEATISVPVSQWNELKSNNDKALIIIEASSVPLTEAQSLVAKQATELAEARTTIDKLTAELQKAKEDSMRQEVTLNEMQTSIDELKTVIERDNRTIKRLRMQRNLSQVVGLVGTTAGISIRI